MASTSRLHPTTTPIQSTASTLLQQPDLVNSFLPHQLTFPQQVRLPAQLVFQQQRSRHLPQKHSVTSTLIKECYTQMVQGVSLHKPRRVLQEPCCMAMEQAPQP